MFANRTNWNLNQNQIITLVNKLKSSNIEIFDLTKSNPTQCGFSYPEEKIIKSFDSQENIKYEPSSQGLWKAREAICQYYKDKGIFLDPDQIFLTASTSEGYSLLFRLLVNPHETVLFPTPSYPLFQFLCDINDINMAYYPLSYHNQWDIDFKRLEGPWEETRPKAIVLVSPNNPTGSIIRRHELDAINGLCKANNIPLICDEVFSDFLIMTQQDQYFSLSDNSEVLTFVLGGLSKALALPQMKLSWIIINGPEKLMQEAKGRLDVIMDTLLSVNTPSQNALKRWFFLKDDIQGQIMQRINKNYSYLEKESSSCTHCKLLRVDAGWYAILKISDVKNEERWILELLEQDHVFIHPGYFFDFEDQGYFILSLIPENEIFKEGVNRILNRINTNYIK